MQNKVTRSTLQQWNMLKWQNEGAGHGIQGAMKTSQFKTDQ